MKSSLSPLRENFTRCIILGCYFFLSSLKYFTWLLLVYMVSDKTQDVHHNEHSCSSILRVSFPLPPRLLSRFSSSLVFCTLHRICSGSSGRVFMFGVLFWFGYVVWKVLAYYHWYISSVLSSGFPFTTMLHLWKNCWQWIFWIFFIFTFLSLRISIWEISVILKMCS